MRKTTKLLSLVLALMFVMAAFAGCGNTSKPAEGDDKGKTPEAPVKGDTIVIATANEPPMLHPYNHNATAANYMNGLTFNALFRANVDTLEPEPDLVEKYEILSDLEWKFTLKKDVKFHNGETLKAEDVKASMEWARTFTYTSMYSAFWDKIEVVDDLTFVITTIKPYAKTLNDLSSHKIVPKALIDSGNDFNTNPIGTGPYKFVKWDLGDSLTFVAFDEYFEGAPAIKNMIWRIIPEGSSRTIALEAGEIDFIIETETNDLARLKDNKALTLVQKTGTQFNYMMINNDKAPFNNQDFRKGLNCAIDKTAVAEVALSGAGTGVYWQTPSVLAGYSEKNAGSYDVALAKQYFDKSGIDPKTVTFSVICSDDTKRRAAEVIQASLAEFGITMNIESMDLATYLATTTEGNYEAALGNYTSNNMMSFIEGVCYSKSIGGSNRSRLNDAEVDRLYELATTQLEAATRTKTLEECSARLNDLCSQIPTYQADTIRAYNAKLQGVGVSASGGVFWQYVSWGK